MSFARDAGPRTPSWAHRRGALIGVALTVALTAPVLTGCGADGLRGSIEDRMSLLFDEVWILAQADVIRVEYVRERSGFVNKVCKVTIQRGDLRTGFDVIADEAFLDRVRVERIHEDGEGLPPVRSGILELEGYTQDLSEPLAGRFSVELETGETLAGDFSGEVIDLGSFEPQ